MAYDGSTAMELSRAKYRLFVLAFNEIAAHRAAEHRKAERLASSTGHM